jgi:hypothetical protein
MKNRIKRLAIAVIIGIMCFIAPVTPCLAIADPDSLTISSLKVFQNIYETGDILFVCLYDIAYASEPTEDCEDAFMFNLYNTAGTTLIAQRNVKYYQYNVTSMYFDATAAAALTWETAYILRITGNPVLFDPLVEGTNQATYTLSISDYITAAMADSREYLRLHCLDLAQDLEDNWGVGYDLVTTTADGERLTATGRIVFLDAIPGLDSAVDDLFQLSSGSMDITWDTHDADLQTTLSMANKAGTTVANAFTGIGAYLGMSGQSVAGLFIVLITLITMGIVFFYSGNTVAAMAISSPIIIMGGWMGLVPLVIIFIAAMLIVLYVLYHFVLRGM